MFGTLGEIVRDISPVCNRWHPSRAASTAFRRPGA